MVDVNLAAICAQEQLVICDTDRCKEYIFFVDCRHELSRLVKNQHFAVIAQNQHETCQLCY